MEMAHCRGDACGNRASSPAPLLCAHGWQPPTWSPERDALLLVGLTDAVVTVAVHPLTRVPVVQVHVGRAVWAGPCAELWEVAGIAGVPACCSRRLQLEREAVYSTCTAGKGEQLPGSTPGAERSKAVLMKPHI